MVSTSPYDGLLEVIPNWIYLSQCMAIATLILFFFACNVGLKDEFLVFFFYHLHMFYLHFTLAVQISSLFYMMCHFLISCVPKLVLSPVFHHSVIQLGLSCNIQCSYWKWNSCFYSFVRYAYCSPLYILMLHARLSEIFCNKVFNVPVIWIIIGSFWWSPGQV